MHTPQTIVVIGTGKTGKGIIRGLSNGNDRVIFCDENFETARSFTNELQAANPYYDVEAVLCSYEATWEADIIILALPSCPDRRKLAQRIKAVATQKIVVIMDDAVKELQDLLPHSRIVRAFTGISDDAFDLPAEQKKTIDCRVTGTSEEAVQTVAKLVRTVGFNPVAAASGTAITR